MGLSGLTGKSMLPFVAEKPATDAAAFISFLYNRPFG